MALTDTQKAKVRAYLGFSSMYIDTIAETRMNTLTSDEITMVTGYLASLAAIDTKLGSLVGESLGLRRVDEIEWQDGARAALDAARGVGRMYVMQLSIMLGTTPLADYYGSGSMSGPLALG